MRDKPNGIRRRIVQPKFAGSSPVEVRPAPPVYRPQAAAQPATGSIMQPKASAGFRLETRPAPAVYKPASSSAEVQTKLADRFRAETGPSRPSYCLSSEVQPTAVPSALHNNASVVNQSAVRRSRSGNSGTNGTRFSQSVQPQSTFRPAPSRYQPNPPTPMQPKQESARILLPNVVQRNGDEVSQELDQLYWELRWRAEKKKALGSHLVAMDELKPTPEMRAARLKPQFSQKDLLERKKSLRRGISIPDVRVSRDAYLTWGPQMLHRADDPLTSQWGASTPFRQWLFYNGGPPTKMNCWEAVLYTAHKAELITKDYIKWAVHLPNQSNTPRFVLAVLKHYARELKPTPPSKVLTASDLSNEIIPRGYVIVFGPRGEHVALSTGKLLLPKDDNGENADMDHGILELDADTNGVSENTIESVLARDRQYASRLTWGQMPTIDELKAAT